MGNESQLRNSDPVFFAELFELSHIVKILRVNNLFNITLPYLLDNDTVTPTGLAE